MLNSLVAGKQGALPVRGALGEPQEHSYGIHTVAVTPEERDVASISVEDVLHEQEEDTFCRAAADSRAYSEV